MIAQVVLPLPLPKIFLYNVPEEMAPVASSYARVRVPFGGRKMAGYIVGIEEGRGEGLKDLQEVIDPFSLLDDATSKLCHFVSHFFIAPLGLVLKCAIPPRLSLEGFLLLETRGARQAVPLRSAIREHGRTKVLLMVRDGKARLLDPFTGKEFQPMPSVFKGGSQKMLFLGNQRSRLEYYKEAIAEALKEDENVILLTPDRFSMVASLLRELSSCFRGRVYTFGSHLKERERAELFFKVRNEGGLVLIGHRSPLFLPIMRNGLIIMDRPEDDEYFTKEAPRFHALHVAMKRAELCGAKLILGSISPPLEVYKGVKEGYFALQKGEIPRSRVWFMDGKRQGYDRALVKIVKESLERRERVAIFVHRRDYAGRVRCELCKRAFLCPSCHATLSFRKARGSLFCASCGLEESYSGICPACGGDLISISDPGIECIEEWIKQSFPSEEVVRTEGQGLSSTSSIFVGSYGPSRGLGIRAETLVLLLSSTFLRILGFRARERVYQILLHMIDALGPSSVFLLAERRGSLPIGLDMEKVYEKELEERKIASFPPFSRFISIELERAERGGHLRKINDELRRVGLEKYVVGSLRRKARDRLILRDVPEPMYERLLALYGLSSVRIVPDPDCI